jgi:esterase/lipase superfamily enzyme
MIEYVVAAIVGAILASVILMMLRLLSQQREQFAGFQTSINQQLDTIRQDGAQGRQRIEGIATDLHGVRQRLGDLMASRQDTDKHLASVLQDARQTIDKLSASTGVIALLDKKVDGISERLDRNAYAVGSVFSGKVGKKPAFTYLQRDDGSIGAHVGRPIEDYINPYSDLDFSPYFKSDDIAPGGAAVRTAPNIGQNLYSSSGSPYTEMKPAGGLRRGYPPPDIPMSVPFPPGVGVPPRGSDSPAATSAPPYGSPAPVAETDAAADEAEKRRMVDLMFATTRKYDDAQERFTGERNSTITFGQASVRIPEAHLPGELERPYNYTLFSVTIYRQKENPNKHFVIRGINVLPKKRWAEILGAMPSDDALLFVHGFNTSFEDALYRNAQIVCDLRFKGAAVLFSWPSRGAIRDYVYDRDSASGAVKPFIEVLELLTSQENIKQIHILAHSMGNQVVLNALANYQSAKTLKIGELIMAAPDVDRDVYSSIALDARKHTKGMTLYASAADKALAASKLLAGDIPRAGDVPEGGPIVLETIDSIDATSLGEEIFGLNHATFSKSLSILNDVYLLLGGKRLPRVLEIISIPEGVVPPKYWQYRGSRS